MINFRYHVVSLIAVFLALGIGVIMGSAVIDRAIVDRLEDQQRGLELQIAEVEETNDALREENRALQEAADRLTEEGSQRLLVGALTEVPVLVIATRGVSTASFDALLSMVSTTGADRQGTIWLTDRFVLDDDEEVRDLRIALEAPQALSVDNLRRLALTELSVHLRALAAGPGAAGDQTTTTTPANGSADEDADDATEAPSVFAALRSAGFLDFDAPDGAASDDLVLAERTRVVLVSGAGGEVPVDLVALPLAGLLVEERAGVPAFGVLAAEDRSRTEEPLVEFVVTLRTDRQLADRLSTVDNIGDFAGRLAAVLALVDLDDGRLGHYGTGPSAQRLLPAPPESGG